MEHAETFGCRHQEPPQVTECDPEAPLAAGSGFCEKVRTCPMLVEDSYLIIDLWFAVCVCNW